MKRLVILLFAVSAFFSARGQGALGGQTAQNTHSALDNIHLTAAFGINISTLHSNIGSLNSLTTVRVGASPSYEYSLPNGHSIEAGVGIFYVDKGGQFDKSIKYRLRLDYVQFPLTVKYNIPLAYDFVLSPFAGWWWARGLSGVATNPQGDDVSAFDYEGVWLRRGDSGFSVGVTLTYDDAVSLSVGYEMGTRNLFQSGGSRLSTAQTIFSLSYRLF